ncbi:hypothetical protein GLAREA_00048 [Glarea lozoyensis ATCC 20868]|uniref:Nucleotidyltransferase n=1 Tax=Glarea lozoyensis (strain ATCC 20868 / MF5171) TaxID=1116229 RepID=S3CTB6_GLAL2|nr:uncharacterized protein GLAREA_00048 [Glarea lozoyensis ATCC 20868]EPE28890.1 hypothetical protein GLAREA_00048 [Glarea lozoyensis ATCC 20868]
MTLPSLPSFHSATQALSHCFQNEPYAIIGSTSILLLGSTTVHDDDIDILVTRNQTSHFRSLLRTHPDFIVDKRTLHTIYNSTPPIVIELLTPPFLYQEKYDANTPVIWVNGVRVLEPVRLLYGKCRSILGRASEEKKGVDAEDVIFLLGWLAERGKRIGGKELGNVTGEFVEWFVRRYGGGEGWKRVLGMCEGEEGGAMVRLWGGVLSSDISLTENYYEKCRCE